MKGYPSYFATKEDYENIMHDFPEWTSHVTKELQELKAIEDDKATCAIALINPDDPESDWITEEIDNPSPIHKQKGFKTKNELDALIAEVEEEEEEVK